MIVVDLPFDVLQHVTEFIGNEKTIPYKSYDLRNFMNISQLLLPLKQQVLYWTLNEQSSEEFYYSAEFRRKVLNRIANPGKQLKLVFTRAIHMDLNVLSGVNSLELALHHKNHDVSALTGLESLILFDCPNVVNFNVLKNLKHLEIQQSEVLTNVSELGGIPHLVLSNCSKLDNLHGLGSSPTQQHLDLSYCEKLCDVSMLSSVHTVKLSGCNEIVDVSSLGKCHTLDLSDCLSLTNVSKLGKVHTLNVSGCPIVDVSALGAVKDLNLSYCEDISDVSALAHVEKLNLSGCAQLQQKDLSCLTSVQELNISHTNITDITCFRGAKVLNVSFCPSLTSLPGDRDTTMPSLRKLILDRDMITSFQQNESYSHFQRLYPHVEMIHDFDNFVNTLYNPPLINH